MTEELRKQIGALIEMTASGNIAAAEELARLVSARMLSVARSIVHNRERAEDIVQDSFVRIIEGAHKFKPGTNGYAWICKIVQNTALNELRRERATVDIEECFYLESGDDTEARSTSTHDVQAAMSVLDGTERLLIYQKYFMDFTVRDSSKSTGLSKSTVARKIVVAESKMREYMCSRDKNGR